MIEITLLDGSKLEFQHPTNGVEIANKISPNLLKNSYAIFVNDELVDLTKQINVSCSVRLITNKNSDVILPLLRHDLAHVLGEAVLALYPNAKLGTGPATENGFFYDFLIDQPFKEEDLLSIENKMKEIIDANKEFIRQEVSYQDADKYLSSKGEILKLEILEQIKDQKLTFYKQGDFTDLCIGPHSPSTGFIPKSFKLNRLSGVYWQGDAKNPMLQRISGVAFLTDKDLDSFLNLQEELEKNDHRKIGKELGLFHLQDEAVGGVFWHDKGWKIYNRLESHIREKLYKNDYQEVKTPQLLDKSLWEASGHWDKFGTKNMFVVNSEEDKILALKPMNCPAHIQIFKQGIKSYKDLPLRMAEFGCCHRNESSGSLHGIMRVRAFTQDDAHIFCTEDQIVAETKSFCKLLKEIYFEIFGDIELSVKFSDRPQNKAGDDAIWDKAEKALMEASLSSDLDPILNKGEGAFYGPKLEFTIKDSLGRQWQLGTFQVDFILPQRLGATYIDSDGSKRVPVMLHRAILGSFERFIGILIEHYKGKFPLWLSPLHIMIITVSNKFDEYAQNINNKFKDAKIFSETDLSSNKISYKIREHTLSKTPIIGIVGEQELANNTITLRFLHNQEQITLDVDSAKEIILNNINLKTQIIKY